MEKGNLEKELIWFAKYWNESAKELHGQITRADIYQSSEFKWLTRRIYLTLSYKFGKLEISNKNKIPGTEGGDN